MSNKVSVIVPIYNVEHFLPKCIDSIIAQTHKVIEIILVNDGSTDNSGIICDQYASKDSRIRVIHKENGGLSDARNAGLNEAKGEYISFIDGDDWIEPKMIHFLFSLAVKEKAQVVMSTITSESEFKKQIISFPWKEDRYFDKVGIINDFLPHLISRLDSNGNFIETISGSVCKCLYNKEFLISNKLFFDVNVGSGQDKEFSLRVLTLCESLFTTNQSFYHYNRSIVAGGSTTQRYSKDLYSKVKYRQGKYIETLKRGNILKQYKLGLNLIWLETVIAVVDNLCYQGNRSNILKIYLDAKWVIKDSNFKEIFETFTPPQRRLLNKRKTSLLVNCLPVYLIANKIKLSAKKIIVNLRKRLR